MGVWPAGKLPQIGQEAGGRPPAQQVTAGVGVATLRFDDEDQVARQSWRRFRRLARVVGHATSAHEIKLNHDTPSNQ